MTEKIFNRLLEANERFLKTNVEYRMLKDSQHPDYVIISCSDSRITPSIVMDQGLGKFFEIRVAGGVVDESALASIEYAVIHLNTKNIFIMAHTKCGAVTEAQKMFGMTNTDNNLRIDTSLDRLVCSIYKNIVDDIENRDNLDNAIIDNAKAQERTILKNSIINEKFMDGELKIGIGLYSIDSGKLSLH